MQDELKRRMALKLRAVMAKKGEGQGAEGQGAGQGPAKAGNGERAVS